MSRDAKIANLQDIIASIHLVKYSMELKIAQTALCFQKLYG